MAMISAATAPAITLRRTNRAIANASAQNQGSALHSPGTPIDCSRLCGIQPCESSGQTTSRSGFRTSSGEYYVCGSQPYRKGMGCGPGVYVPRRAVEAEVCQGLSELLGLCADPERWNQLKTEPEGANSPEWPIVQTRGRLSHAPPPVQPYAPGSWGPEAANELLAGSGRWHEPWIAS